MADLDVARWAAMQAAGADNAAISAAMKAAGLGIPERTRVWEQIDPHDTPTPRQSGIPDARPTPLPWVSNRLQDYEHKYPQGTADRLLIESLLNKSAGWWLCPELFTAALLTRHGSAAALLAAAFRVTESALRHAAADY